jgi:hypothetical protein
MDSKISQLPSTNKIYDGDLLVAVTGYDTEGSYPSNVKINCGLIRRDIVRLNEMIFLLSGFSGYYNSGNNTMTITTHQKEGNLIKLDYEPSWPYMQIISTTGLNITQGEGVGYSISNSFPNKYQLKNTNRAKTGNTTTIFNNNNQFTSSTSGLYNLSNLSYDDFFQSNPNQNIKLLATAYIKITNLVFDAPSFVPGVGQINDRKFNELLSLNGLSYNYTYSICNLDTNSLNTISATKVFNTGDLKDFEQTGEAFVLDSFTLTIGISGGGSSDFIKTIHSQPIVFKNRNGVNASNCSEIYRSGLGNYIYNSIPTNIDPIIIQEPVTLNISSSQINNLNSISICASISNVRYTRNYRYFLVNSASNCLGNFVPIYYTFTTNNTYSSTNATINPQILETKLIL